MMRREGSELGARGRQGMMALLLCLAVSAMTTSCRLALEEPTGPLSSAGGTESLELFEEPETAALPNDQLRDGHRVRTGHIIDGDTLDVLLDGRAFKVRLLGVNAPECHKDSEGHRYRCVRDDEFWGLRSYELARELTSQRMATVRCDVEEPGGACPTDNYDRTLAYLDYDEIGDLAEALIRRGAAFSFTRYRSDRRGRYCAAEYEARRNGAGMWEGRSVAEVLELMSPGTRSWYQSHDSRCDVAIRGL